MNDRTCQRSCWASSRLQQMIHYKNVEDGTPRWEGLATVFMDRLPHSTFPIGDRQLGGIHSKEGAWGMDIHPPTHTLPVIPLPYYIT